MKLPTKKRAKERALKAFSDYIRTRDNFVCYTCNKQGDKLTTDAGHLISRVHAILLFDEDNVHCQCKRCNMYLSGNLLEYRQRFVNQNGEEKFNLMYSIRHTPCSYSIVDFLELEKMFKEKLKKLIMIS
jgi:hypothetical protein